MKKILVVGAGLSGATVARCLAEGGCEVDVIDKRSHVAGNAYDYSNEHGIRVHAYGPHIFHTSNVKVVEWLSRFTRWIDYKHRVRALLSDGTFLALPPNAHAKELLGKDGIINTIYRPYTRKMWGMELEEMDPQILSRVSPREDLNELYFPCDTFQAMPEAGYSRMVGNMLKHEKISVRLNLCFSRLMEENYEFVFNSMPIDEYFNFDLGHLPYRSVRFHTVTLPWPYVLPVATVNFTHDLPYTRVTEWKRFPGHDNNSAFTTLTYEEPCDYRENNLERYYPVKDQDGNNLKRYQAYSERVNRDKMKFIGRCGLYAYLDMHQAVSSALAISKEFLNSRKGFSKK